MTFSMRYVSFAEVVPTTRVLLSGEVFERVATSSAKVSLRFFLRIGDLGCSVSCASGFVSVEPGILKVGFFGDTLLELGGTLRLVNGWPPIHEDGTPVF